MDTAIKDGTWQDITEEFKSSVKQLNLGELLKTDYFTLLEAMSAIELMDPKMDSGMMLIKSNRKILTLEQSVRMGLVKTNQLELTELIGIFDDTYSCLATWLEGYPLAQTVMTNLYLHEPERIEDRCLRVFSQSMLKIVNFLDKLVQMVCCIEEEDFVLNGGKFNLANSVNDQKILNSIEDLCQHYEKLLTDHRQNNSPTNSQSTHNNKKQQPQQAGDCDKSGLQDDKIQLLAIIDRLRFTFNLYACFHNICRFLLKDNWDLGPQNDVQLLKTTKLVQNTVQNCDQNLEKCLKYLDKWKNSIDLGIKPAERATDVSNEGDYPTIMGFDPLINHKLLPPAYPRVPSIKSRPSTLDYLRDLITRLRQCFSISNSFNQRSFEKSLDSIEHFSKYFRPNSCVISRSLMQILYLPNRSVKLLKDEILQSMSDYCEPLVQAMKKDETKSVALGEFVTECSKSFSQVICIYGHNTARQHEKFNELILSFKNLQYSALIINSALNNSVVYSWTTRNLARLCIKYVLAGLELELFSTHEYPYVFWYLYDILYRNEREQLELAKQLIHDSQLLIDENQKKSGKGKGKQRKKSQYSTSLHDKSLLCNDAFRFLTGGTFLLTYGLKMQGKIKSPAMDFTSEEICFDHRFGALTGTSVYNSYKLTLSRLEKLEYIYREALECFSEAKELFTAIGQYEDCLKVCKTNMIVAKILSSNLNSFTDREVEFCFATHPSFPTVKV